MSDATPPRGSARETRLLLLTLGVSVAVLLLLARFRFPERPIADLSPPQPLARLSRTTAFDEMSSTLSDLLSQLDGAVIAVRLTRDGAPVDLPAVRVRDDVAVVPMGAETTGPAIVARDEERGLAAVRVPAQSVPGVAIQSQAAALEVPGYLAIVEAVPDGPTIRAEFVTRITRTPRSGWDVPVLVLAGSLRAKPGALVFTLSGRLLGLVLDDRDLTLVAPADALMARANRLANGENVRIVHAGLDVQALTPAIAKATGASSGVIVTNVDSGIAKAAQRSPANAPPSHTDIVEVGDVITTVDTRAIRSPEEWRAALRTHQPGDTIALELIHFGAPRRSTLTLPPAPSEASGAHASSVASRAATTSGPGATSATSATSPTGATSTGLSLRPRPRDRAVDVIAVAPISPAARAGLRVGDRLVGLPGRGPSTAAIAAAYASLGSGQSLLVLVDRPNSAPFIAAIEKP